MPYAHKTSQPTKDALRRGDLVLAVNGGQALGPTSTTGYYNTLRPPTNGYAIYSLGLNNNPIVMTVTTDDEVIRAANTLGGSVSSKSDALVYLAGRSSTWILQNMPNNIVTDGLVLALNASIVSSYPRSGTDWYDLSGEANDGILTNGVTFNSNGAIDFDGVDDEVNTSYYAQLNDFTVTVLFKDGGTAAWGRIVDKGYSSGFFISSYFTTYGSGYVGCGIIEPTPPHGVALQYDTSRWHSFTSVRSGTTQTIYLDGVTNTATRTVSSATLNNTSVSIGAWSGGTNSQRYTGDVNKVLMYNKALTPTEILQNYYQAPIVTDGLVFAVDANNLVSYPKSGTTAYDLTGNNNGTLTNGTGYSNINGGTWDFDGVNDYINAGDINPTTAQTLSVWVNLDLIPSSQSSNYPQLIGKRDVDLQRAYFFSFQKSTNKVYWEMKDNNGTYFTLTSSKNSWNTSEWYCIDVTFKGSTGLAEIYINGILDNSTTWSLNYVPQTTATCRIGGGNYWLDGKIANAKIYDKALTAAEVTQNYNATKSRFI
jgi:TM2 domain-containing membrane protein YozV